MSTVVGVSCVFCAIVSGESPAHVVYEDDVVIAFLDRHPATVGHTLVVPRRHAADIWSLDVDDAAAVMRAAVEVSRRLRATLGLSGLSLAQSNGVAAGQDVFHFHLHLVPRESGDGLAPPWEETHPDAATLDDVAALIRSPP